MKTITYKDCYIFPNADGSFTGACQNKDGEVIATRKASLEMVKQWIDFHKNK